MDDNPAKNLANAKKTTKLFTQRCVKTKAVYDNNNTVLSPLMIKPHKTPFLSLSSSSTICHFNLPPLQSPFLYLCIHFYLNCFILIEFLFLGFSCLLLLLLLSFCTFFSHIYISSNLHQKQNITV